MLLNNENVSERVYVSAYVCGANKSDKSGKTYINYETPLGSGSAVLYDDVDVTPFVGHVARLALRMRGANFTHSKFPRKWLCDSIGEDFDL